MALMKQQAGIGNAILAGANMFVDQMQSADIMKASNMYNDKMSALRSELMQNKEENAMENMAKYEEGRQKIFDDLKKFAESGMKKYWGRNKSRLVGTDVDINGDKYQVNVEIIHTKSNALPNMKLVYVTNKAPGRSRNWELSRITYYNIGYLKYSTQWYYLDKIDADISFEETISHEIGHEILKYGGGSGYSKTHKGSSTILQNVKKGTSYPATGEIDLMKYAENTNTTNFYDRVVASEEDVKSLIWVGGLKL